MDDADLGAQRDALAAAQRQLRLAIQRATGEDLRKAPVSVLVSKVDDLGRNWKALAARVLELEAFVEQTTDSDGQPLGPGVV